MAQVRRAGEDDLPGVLRIEEASFAIPWSAAALLPELADDGRHLPLVAEVEGEVVAFALLWLVADEMHLVNFAVLPALRRAGIGRKLMNEAVRQALDHGVRRMTLEVRDSNEAARRLYEEFGFVEVALRRDYYPDTREDAVIMLRELDPPQ